MTAEEFYTRIFSPKTEASLNPAGLYELTEHSVTDSCVKLVDHISGAYRYDENFTHKDLLNSEGIAGCRRRNDFILVNKEGDNIEVFLLEMKSSKDDFNRIRGQLQGGIALMSFVHRMGVDKATDIESFKKVKFYAAVLLHTRRLSCFTDLERLKLEVERRLVDRERYNSIPGIICVEKNCISVEQLRQHCKHVTLKWDEKNDFYEFSGLII